MVLQNINWSAECDFFYDMHCRSSETYETHLRLSKYSFDNTLNILVHLVIHQKRVQPGHSEQVHVHVHCRIARLLEKL